MAFRRRISDEPWYIHTPKEGALYRERERDLNNNKRLYIYISLSLSSLGSSCTELIMTDSPPPLFIYIYIHLASFLYICVLLCLMAGRSFPRESALLYMRVMYMREQQRQKIGLLSIRANYDRADDHNQPIGGLFFFSIQSVTTH